MKTPVVVDSTCLIGLERIGRLDILPALFDPVAAPPEVAREFGTPPTWLAVVAPAVAVPLLLSLVDDGEAAAIVLARERGHEIILDDRRARTLAAGFGLKVVGTIGVLLRAKRRGVITALRPLLEALELNGFYLGADLKREALRLAGE